MKILDRFDLKWKEAKRNGNKFELVGSKTALFDCSGMQEIEMLCIDDIHIPDDSFFAVYPDAFNVIAAETRLIETGWKKDAEEYFGGTTYRNPVVSNLKAFAFRGTVAFFNSFSEFTKTPVSCMYSETMKQMVYVNSGRYVTGDDAKEQLPDTEIKEIEKLYENTDS